MKYFISIILFFCLSNFSLAFSETGISPDTVKIPSEFVGKYVKVEKYNGEKFEGFLVYVDNKELKLKKDEKETTMLRIEVKKIEAPGSGKEGKGYFGDEQYATRYLITPSAFAMEKGDYYMRVTLLGPELQVGATSRLTLGAMTSWIFGSPLALTAKYSVKIKEKLHFAPGIAIGSGTWLAPDMFGALPFGTLTCGNQNANFSISGGAVFTTESDPLMIFSLSGMKKNEKNVTLLAETFYLTTGNGDFNAGIFLPGLRITSNRGKVYQFGLGPILYEGKVSSIPYMTFSWLFKFN